MNETFRNKEALIPPVDDELPIEGIEYTPEKLPSHYSSQNFPCSILSGSQKANSPKTDYVMQLAEKIQQQAKQLQELEDYKIICEKRILELCPSQRLPITESQLGNVPSYSLQVKELKAVLSQREQELIFERKRNSQLQLELRMPRQRLSATGSSLESENQSLKESLRAEMLLNEEQRNYIDILKDMLNTKLESLGLVELVKKPLDLTMEVINMKKQTEVYKKQVQTYESELLNARTNNEDIRKQLIILEKSNSELSEEMENMKVDLESMMKALEDARVNNAKLEEEKTSLLDYADHIITSQEQMQKEIKSLQEVNENQKKEFNRSKETYKLQLSKYSGQLRKVKEQYEEKVRIVREALRRLEIDRELNETRGKELKKAIEELNNIRNESMSHISKLKEELEITLSEDKRVIEDQKVSFCSEVKKYKEQIVNLTEENSRLLRDKEKMKESYAALDATLNEVQEELETAKNTIHKLNRDLSHKQSLKNSINKDIIRNEEYIAENKKLKEQVEKLSSELSVADSKHREAVNRTEILKGRINKENEYLKNKLNQLNYLKEILDQCLSLISQFAKDIKSHNLKSVSVGEKFRYAFKDFTVNKANDIQESVEEISKFIKVITKEFELLMRVVGAYDVDTHNLMHKNYDLEVKCSSLAEERLRTTEHYSRSVMREASRKRSEMPLKKVNEVEALSEQQFGSEISRHRNQIGLLSMQENLQLRNAEEKVRFLTTENQDLTSMLEQFTDLISTEGGQKVANNLLKVQLNLHMLIREKHKLTVALTQAEGALRTHITSSVSNTEEGLRIRKQVEQLREEVSRCEEQIETNKHQLRKLQARLIKSTETETIDECKQRFFNSIKKYEPIKKSYTRKVIDENIDYPKRERSTLKERLSRVNTSFSNLNRSII